MPQIVANQNAKNSARFTPPTAPADAALAIAATRPISGPSASPTINTSSRRVVFSLADMPQLPGRRHGLGAPPRLAFADVERRVERRRIQAELLANVVELHRQQRDPVVLGQPRAAQAAHQRACPHALARESR